MAETTLIEMRQVALTLRMPGAHGSVTIMDSLSLAVPDRRFVSILGPSGCGKTTLLRLLAGLIRPTAGEVLVNGQPTVAPRRDVAMVFQEACLLPWRTSLGNVEFGLEMQDVPAGERRERSLKALEMVGLASFRHHYPHQLSGGMKQRIGLARALVTEPRILLMDEPFAALDAQTRETLQTELLRLWESNQKTVVFVTHSIEESILLSDEVVILGSRPASVRHRVPINLPRPRWKDEDDLRAGREFGQYRRQITECLRAEAQGQSLPAAVGEGVPAWLK